MSEAAQRLRAIEARVGAAAAALARADFAAFAQEAGALEAAAPFRPSAAGLAGDAEARQACLALRRSLDRMGALLGHVAGVERALHGPDKAAAYDRRGVGAGPGGGSLSREA